MKEFWKPSGMGRAWTHSPSWQLSLDEQIVELTIDGNIYRTSIQDESTLQVHQGLIWTDLTLRISADIKKKVDGLPNQKAESLNSALALVIAKKKLHSDCVLMSRDHSAIKDWLNKVSAEMRHADAQHRWLTHEIQESLLHSRPNIDGRELWTRFRNLDIQKRLFQDPLAVEKELKLWESDWLATWERLNEQHIQRELVACKDLFDKVESQPLTEEQSRAVICFDNRVQVVASAGSGKTSTMVAKAAYAIQRGLVLPERIVLLAFNKQAADELKERAKQSFSRLGMTGITVEASTFHALGLSIIGKATGRKPDVPVWAVDPTAGFKKLSEIIDQLKDRSDDFRTRWDMFRLVFSRDLPAFGASGPASGWDKEGNEYLLTLNGDRVRSEEELMIANWLFYNGVNYKYEGPYEFDTATESHRQYRPDFYYPDVKLYHEHFALNDRGEAPPHFIDYLEGVIWKRQLHKEKRTDLFETTSHMVRNLNWMSHLEAALTDRGIVLDPNPDRPIPIKGEKPMENAELAGLVRTFISHTKSNCLSFTAMNQRLEMLPKDTHRHRYRMFLDIVEPVLQAWDTALSEEDGIDFEDMLNLAAEHLEKGRYDVPYDLVMADEFQDASRSRARLCRAMVQKPGRYLFAVGDDWQSINRFAGADVSVMTGFQEWFGHGQVLKLEQTFRCPQELCDVSSRFVCKNPAQISKQVRSVTPPVGPVLQAFQVEQREKLQSAIDQFLDQLCQALQEGAIPPGRNGKVTVAVLGRYNFDRDYLPNRWQARYGKWLELSFLTIHRSKGSEADYVILPSMNSVARGRSFPNTRADDPVLALAMPSGDNFDLSEERRLFYVAMTRARRSVALFSVRGQQSTFLRELVNEEAVVVKDTDGKFVEQQQCLACEQGVIIIRNGSYGEFQSCSNFPRCEYKPTRTRVMQPTKTRASPFVKADFSNPRAPGQKLSSENSPLSLQKNHSRPAFKIASQQSDPENERSTPHTVRPTFGNFLKSVSSSIEEINKSVTGSLALQTATSELKLNIYAEKITIMAALDSAKNTLEVRKKLDADPEFAKEYKIINEKYQSLFDKMPSEPKLSHSHVTLPDFKNRPRHSDPDIEEAIQRKVESMRDDRDAFMSSIQVEFSKDSKLCSEFKEQLRTLGGSHLWPPSHYAPS